jgi:hypothetical protein
MLSPEHLEALVKREQTLTMQLDQAGVKSHPCFSQLAGSGSGARGTLKDGLQQYLWEFDQVAAIPDAWLQRVIFDVSSDRHAIWQHLHDSTRHKCEQVEATWTCPQF